MGIPRQRVTAGSRGPSPRSAVASSFGTTKPTANHETHGSNSVVADGGSMLCCASWSESPTTNSSMAATALWVSESGDASAMHRIDVATHGSTLLLGSSFECMRMMIDP